MKAVELCTGRPTSPDNPNTDPRVGGSDWDAIVDLIRALTGPEESAQVALQEAGRAVVRCSGHRGRRKWTRTPLSQVH